MRLHCPTLSASPRIMNGPRQTATCLKSASATMLRIEPTESESKETLDEFIAAMRRIAGEAEERSQILQHAPHCTRSRRLDENRAARKLCLSG